MRLVIMSSPSSTFFPYTTLFRSPGLRGERDRLLQCRAPRLSEAPGEAHQGVAAAPVRRRRRRHRAARSDRKSTRLNSSHLVISYAVFCLKKKNNYEEIKRTKSND